MTYHAEVTLYNATIICSICGREVDWSRDDCGHFPNVEYEVDGERVLCYYIITDATLGSLSMVRDDDGTPTDNPGDEATAPHASG